MSDEKRDPASPPADDAPQIPDAYAYKVGDVVFEVVDGGIIPQIGVVLSISRPTGTRDPLKDFVRVRVSEKSVADSQRAKFRRIDSVMPTNLAAAVSFICESFDQMIKEQASPPAAHDTFIPDSPDAIPARGDDGAPIPQGDPIPAPSVTVDAMEVSMIRDAQRRLEVSQAREKEALETIRRLRKELEEHQNMLANTKRLNADALNVLNFERNVSREALESAEAQAKRGDLWQDAAHDALEQAKLWRERAQEERAACARIMDERLTWQQRADEEGKAHRRTMSELVRVRNELSMLREIQDAELCDAPDAASTAPSGAHPVSNEGREGDLFCLPIVNHRGEKRYMKLYATSCRVHHDTSDLYPDPTPKITGWDVDRMEWRTVQVCQLRIGAIGQPVNYQEPPVNNEPDTRHESDDY